MPPPPSDTGKTEVPDITIPDGHTRTRVLSSARFKIRLAMLVVVLVGGLTILQVVVIDRTFATVTEGLESDLRWKATRGTSELRYSTDIGVLVQDREMLRAAASRYLQDPDVAYLSIAAEDGTVLLESGQPVSSPARPTLVDEDVSLTESDQTYDAYASIVLEGVKVGSVRLTVSKQRLFARSDLERQMLTSALIGCGLALLAALAFVSFYISPVLRLVERTLSQLAVTAEAALSSARAKSRFLANMSHEIRTPMNGVLGMTQLLLEAELPPALRRKVELISESGSSLLTIVNDILDFSKLDENKYKLYETPCRVRDIVDQTLELLRSTATKKGLSLSATFSDDVPDVISTDANRLRQVLTNLIGNAVKFTDTGYVKVQVSATASETSDVELVFDVEDSGIGVSEEARPHLFDAFTQADETSTRSFEGTGLGLSICRKLVTLMRGEIVLVDRDGPGSVFRVRLPVALSDQEAPASRPSGNHAVRFDAGTKILVADDNELNREIASEMLSTLGLEVEVAVGGAEAVELASKGTYRAILMDCQMPDVDGYEATRRIRASRTGGTIPIIACTAHALEEERERVADAGMDDYLAKPISLRHLSDVLRTHIQTERSPATATPRPISSRPEANTPVPAEIGALPSLTDRRRSHKLITLFLGLVPDQIAELERAVGSKDVASTKRIAHKLRGSCGSIGALKMSGLCRELEVRAGDVTPATNQELLFCLKAAHRQVRGLLDEELGKLEAS